MLCKYLRNDAWLKLFRGNKCVRTKDIALFEDTICESCAQLLSWSHDDSRWGIEWNDTFLLYFLAKYDISDVEWQNCENNKFVYCTHEITYPKHPPLLCLNCSIPISIIICQLVTTFVQNFARNFCSLNCVKKA